MQNGDAYLPTKNSPDSNGTPTGTNPEHSDGYYDYSIYMPPGSTNGQVYIYDPGFCDTGFDTNSNTAYGTGDRWFVPTGTHANTNAVSSYYKLYDTNNQPYNLAAQTPLGGLGQLLREHTGGRHRPGQQRNHRHSHGRHPGLPQQHGR